MSHLHLIHVMKRLREVKTNDSIQTLFALRDTSQDMFSLKASH